MSKLSDFISRYDFQIKIAFLALDLILLVLFIILVYPELL